MAQVAIAQWESPSFPEPEESGLWSRHDPVDAASDHRCEPRVAVVGLSGADRDRRHDACSLIRPGVLRQVFPGSRMSGRCLRRGPVAEYGGSFRVRFMSTARHTGDSERQRVCGRTSDGTSRRRSRADRDAPCSLARAGAEGESSTAMRTRSADVTLSAIPCPASAPGGVEPPTF